MRVIVLGGPRCGKTTFAASLGAPKVRCSDDVAALGWSEASAEVATWLDAPGPWVIEGVALARALRKWLAAHPDGSPCDVVHVMHVPRVELTPGQTTMAKGCLTVWNEIAAAVRARGVRVEVAA